MQLVDTHSHIFASNYPLDAEEVLARAQAAGVTRIVCVGTDLQTSHEALDFAHAHQGCWASVGLHPHDASQGAKVLARLRKLAQQEPRTGGSRKLVAIGECGLDYFYQHSPKEAQATALRAQIELALEFDLPLIFHVREAFDDFWPMFDRYQGIRGVLHSFTDTQKNLDMALARGLYIGVNGIVTFTKLEWQLEVARRIPLDKMVLETDAPFLTPAPLRGKINESTHVSLVCGFIAELRREPAEHIAAHSTHNALTLFSLS